MLTLPGSLPELLQKEVSIFLPLGFLLILSLVF